MSTKGTPRTLLGAIENGIIAYQEHTGARQHIAVDLCALHVKNHVRDFLAQRFGPPLLASDDLALTQVLTRLFTDITEPPKPEDLCDCADCCDSDQACAADCDTSEDDACVGCREAKDAREETEFEVDCALGRK